MYRTNAATEKDISKKSPLDWGLVGILGFWGVVVLVIALIAHFNKSKEDTYINMCKPNYYVGTYDQAHNLYKVVCFNKEDNSKYFYFVEE